MSARVSNRDKPVLALNRKASRTAYACYTLADYGTAERFFYSKYLERDHLFGPWAKPTVACLNNWITALVKLQQHEIAENLCRTKLQQMTSANLQGSSSFACIQCSLAASLSLSGDRAAAEELFDDIRARQVSFATTLAQDYFEVLVLVLLTSKDCLVFRDSATHLPVLFPVTDYITQLEDLQPRDGGHKSGLGSSLKMISTNRSLRQTNRQVLATTSHRPTGFFKRLFGRDTAERLSSPSKSDISGPVPPPAIGNSGCPCFQHRFEEVLAPVDEEDAETSVRSWLDDPAMPEEIYPPPPTIRQSIDASLGLTHRSTDTTTSSQPADYCTKSLLAITAWAADRQIQIHKQLNALLDTGAPKSLVSLDFAQALHAPITPADDVYLSNPDGSDLEVLGCIKVGFSWQGPSGSTKFARIQCYIIRDLQTGMIIGDSIINKLKLLDAPQPLFGPIIFSPRSKKDKAADAAKSKDIIAARKAEAEREAAARAAERSRLDAIVRANANAAATRKISPKLRPDSPMGGSDTTVASCKSSMTFSSRSNTISTITSIPSLRTTTSSETQRSNKSYREPRRQA